MFLLKKLINAPRIEAEPLVNEASHYLSKLDYDGAKMPIRYTTRLAKIPADRQDEEANVVGGMRNTATSLAKVPGHSEVGKHLGKIITDMINTVPGFKVNLMLAIDRQYYDKVLLDKLVEQGRIVLATALGCKDVQVAVAPVQNENCSTCIRAHLLRQWAIAAKDPAVYAVAWLFDGAPLGLDFYDDALMSRLWPLRDDGEEDAHFSGAVLQDEMEDTAPLTKSGDTKLPEEDVLELVEGYEDKHYIDIINRHELQERFGDDHVISKLLPITKDRFDATTKKYVKKTRTVLGLKASGVSKRTILRHKGVLPRATDAISNLLALLYDASLAGNKELVEQLVMDVIDAYWLVPNKPGERRWFIARVGELFAVWLRTPQGSRDAGLTWATIVSLVGRCLLSLFPAEPNSKHKAATTMLMQIYVDDPWCAARGTREQIDTQFAVVAAVWLILGFPMAFHKASRGPKVNWTGITISLLEDGVLAEVMDEKVEEVKAITK